VLGLRGRNLVEDHNAMREDLRDGEEERQSKHQQLLREKEEATRLLVV